MKPKAWTSTPERRNLTLESGPYPVHGSSSYGPTDEGSKTRVDRIWLLAWAATAIGPMEVVVLLATTLLVIWPAYRICSKAGFPEPLGLLAVVPEFNLVLLLVLAFVEWPALRPENLENRAGPDEPDQNRPTSKGRPAILFAESVMAMLTLM